MLIKMNVIIINLFVTTFSLPGITREVSSLNSPKSCSCQIILKIIFYIQSLCVLALK